MKLALTIPVTALVLALTGGKAESQETRAISRLVTVYAGTPTDTRAASRLATVFTGLPSDTQAVSRLATLYTGLPGDTRAVSRLITEYSGPDATQAASRLVTAWLGLTVQNAAAALRIAAGLQSSTPREKQVFDLIFAGTSVNVIDVLDACQIAIYAMNPSRLP